MFFNKISGKVSEVSPNDQTRFQCSLTLTVPLDDVHRIEPGTLIAAENMYFSVREKRYTVLQIVNSFPIQGDEKTKKTITGITFSCVATPIGLELHDQGAKKPPQFLNADTFPKLDTNAFVLDDETTANVIHQIAPESRTTENGVRVDVGTYATNPYVKVGLDSSTLVRGNIAIISARPRARTSITNSLVAALVNNQAFPMHIVYCDVNNQGTLSLINLLTAVEKSGILCLNDKFIPSSVFGSLKNPNDRQAHKRAVLDFLDMMILPSVLENRRHDFSYAMSTLFRSGKIGIYRAHEQTIDQFINDIRIDILDGLDEEVEGYISELMDGIASTYSGERFSEKNTRDILEIIDEFSQDSKSHASRRTLYDLRAEVQAIFETYSKDLPPSSRKTMQDIVTTLNDETHSSLLVVQGQKTTDILRFISVLSQTLIEERLKRLKIRVPVLFIFNNIDEYVARNGGIFRETGSERFQDILQTLQNSGRRHGIGFCLTLESAGSLDKTLARKIQSYFVGPITFTDEPPRIAQLMNVSEALLRPAVNYEDGRFLFASADSPYHRRVPLPVSTEKNTDVIHAYLDELVAEQERRRKEYQAHEEDRTRRFQQEREERKKKQAEEAARRIPQPEKPKEIKPVITETFVMQSEDLIHKEKIVFPEVLEPMLSELEPPPSTPEEIVPAQQPRTKKRPAKKSGGKAQTTPKQPAQAPEQKEEKKPEVKSPQQQESRTPALKQKEQETNSLTFETTRHGGWGVDETEEEIAPPAEESVEAANDSETAEEKPEKKQSSRSKRSKRSQKKK